MLKRLSKRDRRALIILAFFVATIPLAFLVKFILDQRSAVQGDLRGKVQLLQRSIRTIGEQERFHQELEQIEERLSLLEGRLLDAPSSNVAQTRLLGILKDLESETGVTITRTSPIPDQKAGPYTKVMLMVNLDCEITELADFLNAIVTHPKFLVVEDFNLNIGRSRRARQRRNLRPRIKVAGYISLS